MSEDYFELMLTYNAETWPIMKRDKTWMVDMISLNYHTQRKTRWGSFNSEILREGIIV